MDPEDIFTNSTWEMEESVSPTRSERLFMELFTLVGLVGVVANVSLIIAIVKFKQLRDVTNIIFVHLNGLQAFYFIASPLTVRVFYHVDFFSPRALRIYCVFNEIEFSIMLAMLMLLILLITDCHIKIHKKETYRKFERIYRFLLALIYVIMICASSLCTFFCLTDVFYLGTWIMFCFTVIFLIVYIIVMNLVHACKKRKLQSTNYFNLGLIVSNITLLAWLPALTSLFVSSFGIALPFIFYVLLVMFGFSSPVMTLVYLYLYENNYHVFLQKVFTCKCNDYRNEHLVEHPTVVFNNV